MTLLQMVAMDLTGNTGRWILVMVGILIVFVATESHRKVYANIVGRSPQVGHLKMNLIGSDRWPRSSGLNRLGIRDYF